MESNKKKSILVVLVGWTGSKPKHMQKYYEIFDEFKNSLTIHTVYPISYQAEFMKKNKINSLAQDTLNFIASFIKSNRNPIVIFYIFCNSGAFLMAAVNNLLCADNKYKNMFDKNELVINGIIFESCPGQMPALYINQSNRYLKVAHPRLETYPTIVQYSLYSMNYIVALLVYGVYILSNNELMLNYFEKLLSKNNSKILSIPSLFLYSNSDKIIYVKDVEKFIAMKRDVLKKHLENTNNNSVGKTLEKIIKTHNFNDSPHVQHYLNHKAEYKKIVSSFLFDIINESSATTIGI
eukprot:12894_1